MKPQTELFRLEWTESYERNTREGVITVTERQGRNYRKLGSAKAYRTFLRCNQERREAAGTTSRPWVPDVSDFDMFRTDLNWEKVDL